MREHQSSARQTQRAPEVLARKLCWMMIVRENYPILRGAHLLCVNSASVIDTFCSNNSKMIAWFGQPRKRCGSCC